MVGSVRLFPSFEAKIDAMSDENRKEQLKSRRPRDFRSDLHRSTSSKSARNACNMGRSPEEMLRDLCAAPEDKSPLNPAQESCSLQENIAELDRIETLLTQQVFLTAGLDAILTQQDNHASATREETIIKLKQRITMLKQKIVKLERKIANCNAHNVNGFEWFARGARRAFALILGRLRPR